MYKFIYLLTYLLTRGHCKIVDGAWNRKKNRF